MQPPLQITQIFPVKSLTPICNRPSESESRVSVLEEKVYRDRVVVFSSGFFFLVSCVSPIKAKKGGRHIYRYETFENLLHIALARKDLHFFMQFKVDSLQIIVVDRKYIYVS